MKFIYYPFATANYAFTQHLGSPHFNPLLIGRLPIYSYVSSSSSSSKNTTAVSLIMCNKLVMFGRRAYHFLISTHFAVKQLKSYSFTTTYDYIISHSFSLTKHGGKDEI